MLELLELQNFQCHKRARVEFSAGVNVIAGTSDVGKSALLKGLLWLVTNRPQGLGFRNADAGKDAVMRARMVIDGHEVVRNRSEAVNEYLLDGKRFVAMKNEVPKDVAQVLNIAPVNIQTQFQPHYLLASSPGEVARALNESCDLSVIDSTMKRVKAIEQEARNEERVLAGQEAEQERELEALAWVDAAAALAEALRGRLPQCAAAREQCALLERLGTELAGLERELELERDMEAAFRPLADIVSRASKWQAARGEHTALMLLADAVASIDVTLAELVKGERARLSEALPALEKEAAALRGASDEARALESLIRDLRNCAEAIERAGKRLQELRDELADCWKRAGVCPLCGAKIG